MSGASPMKRELVVLLLLIANVFASWATARAPVRRPALDRPALVAPARLAQNYRLNLPPRDRLQTCVAL